MNIDVIQDSFKSAVAGSVNLFPEGVNRYQIFTPFHFDDGDHFVIVLHKEHSGNWIITDEGHTYMHMSYHMDLSSLKQGPRNTIIEGALEKYGIEEKEGQILVRIDEPENAGNIFYNFIQCLISITDVSYLNRERVTSTFMEDFKQFIRETIDAERVKFDYCDKSHDPDGKYQVDCRINGMSRPVHIYAVGNDNKCRDTTISILQFQSWSLPFFALGIFADQEQINRKVLSRFTDVCDRQFSSLAANRDKIEGYLRLGELAAPQSQTD